MTLDQRVLNLIKKYMEKLFQKKVLTSMEEVAANTNETNLVAAPVVAELNDKLAGQPEWIMDATGKITGYKTGGADTVFPFSSNYRVYYKVHAYLTYHTSVTKEGYFDIINGKLSGTASLTAEGSAPHNGANPQPFGGSITITRIMKL